MPILAPSLRTVIWYQGDHSIFVQYGHPAIAVTSQWFLENMTSQEITHTPKDNPEIVDCKKLCEIALALTELILGYVIATKSKWLRIFRKGRT